jgi:predicted Zn-dependent protease with MMP-like domain
MEKIELVENVLVFNGIDNHKIQYVYSPQKIKACVNQALNKLPPEFIKEINQNNIQVYIETDLEYSVIKYRNLKTENKDMLFRFQELTSDIF